MDKVVIKTLCVFDIDGVICDSLESRQAAWVNASAKSSLNLGILSPEQIGYPLDEILFFHGITSTKKIRDFKAHFETFLDSLAEEILFPGAKKVLEMLRSNPSVQIAFFSGRPAKRILSAIRSVGLPEDIPFVSANGVDHCPKPSGAGLTAIMEGLGLKSLVRTFLIGDTQLDYLAATEAGFEFIYVDWGYGDISDEVDFERVVSWDALAYRLNGENCNE